MTSLLARAAALVVVGSMLVGCDGRPGDADAVADAGEVAADIGQSRDATRPGADASLGQALVRTGALRDVATDAAIERWHADLRAAIRAHAATLDERDSRSKAALALLLAMADEPGVDFEQSRRTRERMLGEAARAAPDDLQIARLEAMYCMSTSVACSHEDALARWQRLEPDNSAAWLGALQQATAAKDSALIDALLLRAASASHHDLDLGGLALLLDDELSRIPLPPRDDQVERRLARDAGLGSLRSDEDLRALWVAGTASAAAIPAFFPLLSTCRTAQGATTAGCASVFRQLAAADTLLERGIGIAGMRQLTTGTASEPYWREQQRLHDWRLQSGQLRGVFDSAYLRRSWEIGEVPAIDERLTKLGRATPPPGWKASHRDG